MAVWGTLAEALEAIANPLTPEWALRRAAADRKEPEIRTALAGCNDPQFFQIRREQARLQSQQQTAEERQAHRDRYVDTALEALRRTTASGRPAFLHHITLIDSGYLIDHKLVGAAPSTAAVSELGWNGWEVAGIFPQTHGIPLVNALGGQEVYAGGIGGMVSGAYLLMRFSVRADDLANDEPGIRAQLALLFEHEFPLVPAQPGELGVLRRSGPGQSQNAGATSGIRQAASFVGYGFSISTPIPSAESEDLGDSGDFEF